MSVEAKLMNKTLLSQIKINILYGAIFLIPLAIMALLFAKLVEFLEGIAKALQFDSTWGAAMAVLVALAALLLLCFAVGQCPGEKYMYQTISFCST